jgi:hypothetical protein
VLAAACAAIVHGLPAASYTPPMSRASALIWVVLAAILGGLVWWTTPRGVVEVPGSALLDAFATSDVRRIRVTAPDGGVAAIERGPLDGLWLMTLGQNQTSVVVEASRVQGFLRLVAELRASVTEGRPMPKAAIVELIGASGTLATIAIDPEFLAGKGRVALLNEAGQVVRVAATSEDLGALLRPDALSEWRSKALLGWAPERSSSLLIRRGDTGVSIARVGTGWLMSAPLQLKADPGAVQGVSLWLANTTVDRFLDDAGATESFATSVRTIVVGTESLDRRRIEQRIELGPAVDARSSLVRITGVDRDSVSGSGAAKALWGPTVAVVQTSVLTGLSDDAASYLPKTSFDFPSADVAALRVGSSTVSRGSDGSFGPNDATVRAALKLLTEVPAASVTLLPGPGGAAAEATRVTLLGLGGATIGAATLEFDSIASRTEGAPSMPAIRVTVDRVQRVIAMERAREFLAALKSIDDSK